MRKISLALAVTLTLLGVNLGCGGSSDSSATTGKSPVRIIDEAYNTDPMAKTK